MRNIILLLISSILLSGCSLSGNGPSRSRHIKTSGSMFRHSVSDSIEECKKLEKFCTNGKFNKYGNPKKDGTKDDNFYCVCTY
tara:strand:- start:175 stop:423 length:249 start_codon:yes stop_codon:yes gene_type:complete